ncbi:MAG: hypothetical protein AAFX06_18515 [Planctomycetota bacterium]
MLNITCIFMLACWVQPQQGEPQVFTTLIRDVNSTLLGSELPVKTELGSIGFALATGIPSLEDHATETPSCHSYSLGSGLDRPLIVENGHAAFNGFEESLASHWKEVVLAARSESPKSIGSAWLDRPARRTEIAAGVELNAMPSHYLVKFSNFEKRIELLQRCRANGNELWRLIPSLKGYLTFDEALRSERENWELFGWRSEIQGEFEAISQARYLHRPTRLLRESIDGDLTTYYSPLPETWSNMANWIPVQTRIGGRQVEFEISRVRVIRPWFNVSLLYDGRVFLDESLLDRPDVPLSRGEETTLLTFPTGKIGTYIEEIILLRRSSRGGAVPPELYSHSNVVNVLGFVVRGLPKLP